MEEFKQNCSIYAVTIYMAVHEIGEQAVCMQKPLNKSDRYAVA